MQQPPSRRRRNHKLRNNHHNKRIPTGVALAAGFVLLWGIAVWVSHASLSGVQQMPGIDQLPQQISQPQQPDPNPYFGWQPPIAQTMACPWRDCFKEKHSCTTCRDQPADMGTAPPPVPPNWIPDVTVLARMRAAGVDADGHAWPPPLDLTELCQAIGPQGGTQDSNKQCTYLRHVAMDVF